MTSEQTTGGWPRKIFLDTTELYTLGPQLDNVELAQLQQLRKWLHFDVLISEVSMLEHIREQKRYLRTAVHSLSKAQKALETFSIPPGDLAQLAERGKDFLENRFDLHLRQLASEREIGIIPLPTVDLETLLDMSLNYKPPFERKGEKGFRDSLIMFSIMQTIQGRPEDNALLVTNDKRLKAGCQLALDTYDTRLTVVESLAEMHTHMNRRISQEYVRILSEEGEEAKGFLAKHLQEIENRLTDIQPLTVSNFGGGLAGLLGGSADDDANYIEKVLSIHLAGIQSAIWKNKEKANSRILFKIRCEATVIIRKPTYHPAWETKKFMLGGQTIEEPTRMSFGTPTEKILEMYLYGDATLVRNQSDWDLVDVKLNKRFPIDDEWRDLMRIDLND